MFKVSFLQLPNHPLVPIKSNRGVSPTSQDSRKIKGQNVWTCFRNQIMQYINNLYKNVINICHQILVLLMLYTKYRLGEKVGIWETIYYLPSTFLECYWYS